MSPGNWKIGGRSALFFDELQGGIYRQSRIYIYIYTKKLHPTSPANPANPPSPATRQSTGGERGRRQGAKPLV